MQQSNKLMQLTGAKVLIGLFISLVSCYCCCVEGAMYTVSLPTYNGPADAITALRKLSLMEPLQDKCTRMTALLIQMQKTNTIDTLSLHKIAQEQISNLAKQTKSIPPNDLTKLIFAGLDSYVEASNLDKAYIDLMDCARFIIQGSSYQNLRDLASDRYVVPALQLKSILQQPATFFADPKFKHPTLKASDLVDPVRRTVLSWFENDHSKLKQHFASPEDQGVQIMGSKVDEVFGAILDAYKNMDDRWTANNKCEVYSDYAKFGSGKIDRNQADRKVKNLVSRLANLQKPQPWVPNSEDSQDVINLILAASRDPKHKYDPVILELIDCLVVVFKDQTNAFEFMESEVLSGLIDEIESSFQAETPADTIETHDDQPEEPNEESDDEEDADSDSDSDSDDEDFDGEEDDDSDDDDDENEDEEDGEEGDDQHDQDPEEEEDQAEEGGGEAEESNEQEEEHSEEPKIPGSNPNVVIPPAA